jgi:molybdopterin biosynthesis enzyme
MPAGTDSILPIDAVSATKTGAEALASALPGDGVMAAGGEAAAGAILRRAGERLRPSDAAVLRAAGFSKLTVRSPRLTIYCASVRTRSPADRISPLLARGVEGEGGVAQLAQAASPEAALLDVNSDGVLLVGGSGSGRRDASVKTLARVGRVEIHGFGLAPGETAAFGEVNARPVLILPGRLDAALAVWLVVGRYLLGRLAGRVEPERGVANRLTKKVTSTVGLADFIPVRRTQDGLEPLASGYITLNALARADGWILVPPESEGFAAGSNVEMRSFP